MESELTNKKAAGLVVAISLAGYLIMTSWLAIGKVVVWVLDNSESLLAIMMGGPGL